MRYFDFLSTYLLARKNVVCLVLFSVLTLGSLLLLYNSLQNKITQANADDIHTINYGISSLYTGSTPELRVGESTRWLARMVYPAGLYYMNSNMGGEHFITGWNYPGGNYVLAHFRDQSDVQGDPNLQDLEFALKFALGAIVIFSFLLASYFMIKPLGLIAGLAYFTFALSSGLINEMFTVFYTESTLVILFNLILAFAFTPKVNTLRLYVWLALIFALSMSAKLTGAVFLIPILIILKEREGENWLKGLRIEAFVLLIAAFVIAIHHYASDLMNVLDQTLANVYHYKTGHMITEPSGMYQLKQIFSKIPFWLSLFPFAVGFIAMSTLANKKVIMAIALTAFIILGASVGMNIFVERNLTTPLTMIIFIVSVAFSLLVIRIKNKWVKPVAILVPLLFFSSSWISYYKPINEEAISSYDKVYKNIALIDVSKKYFPNATVLPSMPAKFNLNEQLPELVNPLFDYECVIVKRVGNNKHYTNYLLPMGYRLVARVGSYFVYEQEKWVNQQRNDVRQLSHLTPLADGKFKIYRDDNNLIFYKANCSETMIRERFFLHIYPVNIADLPADRTQVGFLGADFNFPLHSLVAGEAYLSIPLPTYPVKYVETGQFIGDYRLWDQVVNF